MKSSVILFLIIFLPLSIFCSGKDIDSPEKVLEEDGLLLKKETEHFQLFIDDVEEEYLNNISEYLEVNSQRILNKMNVDNMPDVKMKLWRNSETFYEIMLAKTGTVYEGATGYVYGNRECLVLLSNYFNMDSKTTLHEYAHLVTMQVNPGIPNNPRWLWEAAALYLTDDFVDPASIQYMISGDFPTIEELNIGYNDGYQKIYQVGYILAEYIVEHWSMDHFIDLINTNGDITGILGVSTEEFEEGWHEYIRGKYF